MCSNQSREQPVPSRPELLSPAGDRDCLAAAIANGADAVYLGIRKFNARANAGNFSLEELERAVKYSHGNGVRVYLTMNTMVKNHEFKAFFNTVSRAYCLGIDGVIIQHISFLPLIKESFPDLKVFISTQAAIGNTACADLLDASDRVILPRELTLEEVKKFVNAGICAEVFVHGALCFSYSGLCLFSSFVGDRSGNRGCCAQLCRQRYNGCYPLSTKELCLVRRIPELIQAGVTGLKIEGRMRSALYVAVATRLYRKAIDSFLSGRFSVPEKEMSEIEVVFNREFTEGFMFGETDLVSPEKPMNRGALLGVIEGGEILLRRPLLIGDGVGIWGEKSVRGDIIREMFLSGRKVNSAAAGERVNPGIRAADGSKVYLTSSARIGIKPDFTVQRAPIVLSHRGLQRGMAATFATQGNQRYGRAGLLFANRQPTVQRWGSAPGLLVKVYSTEEGRQSLRAGADFVFYDIFAPDFPGPNGPQDFSFGAYLPRILNDKQLSRALDLLSEKRPAAVLTGNLGLLPRRSEFDVPVYLDYSLNTFNDHDMLFFQRYNVTPVLSPELSLDEMIGFRDRDAVILCHGDIAVMNTLVPTSGNSLTDEKGASFPVRKEGSYWKILNSRPFGMFNDIRKLRDAGFTRFLIDKESRGAYFTKLYKDMLEHDVPDRRLRKGHTSGHLYRPVR